MIEKDIKSLREKKKLPQEPNSLGLISLRNIKLTWQWETQSETEG